MKNIRNTLIVLWLSLICMAGFAQIRLVAEWEPMQGVLIRFPFGITTSLIRSLAEEDTVYILVSGTNAQNQAINTLNSAQVNLDNCRFVTAPTNSHWTRDWGPHSLFTDNQLPAIADPIFDGYPWVPGLRDDRDYELDNAVNGYLANHLGIQLVDFPAYLTGGNFMTDGYGTAFSTNQMLNENLPLMQPNEFISLGSQLLGIDDYHFTINPEFHGIQHIDCWAKLLNEETVLVKQLPLGHPEYDRAESIAAMFAQISNCFDRPYRVVRIFCDTYSGNSAAAYTNSLILNKRVFVPIFDIPADSAALQTYADAMPGYEILGFSGTWYHFDALHCRTMGIADFQMLRLEHRPPDQISHIQGSTVTLEARIRSYGAFQLIPDSLRVVYKIGSQSNVWNHAQLMPGGANDQYQAQITGLADGDQLSYYLQAADASGRQQTLPITAPATQYNTTISMPVGNSDELLMPAMPSLYPQPAKDFLAIRAGGKGQKIYEVRIYNLKGQILYRRSFDQSESEVRIDLDEFDFASGVHLVKILSSFGTSGHRIVLFK